MILYPEVLKRAQEELDRVVGKDTLPSFEDQENLPYINAIFLECLRYGWIFIIAYHTLTSKSWEIVLPLGISWQKLTSINSDSSAGLPHALERDDIYNGYFIPKGTVVYPNQWYCAILTFYRFNHWGQGNEHGQSLVRLTGRVYS